MAQNIPFDNQDKDTFINVKTGDDETLDSPPLKEPVFSPNRSARKDFLFILGFAVLIILVYLSPLKHYVTKVPALSEKIKEFGIIAPAVFMAGVAALVCIGVPRLLLCPIGGMAFGFFWGLIYSVAGTILGYYAVFLFVRWGGRNFAVRHYPKIGFIKNILDHGGIPAVILARQVPVHGMVLNLFLGLSPVKHRDFLVGTAIGLIPEAIPFTLIGKGIKQGDLFKSTTYVILALVILSILWLGLKIWLKRRTKSNQLL